MEGRERPPLHRQRQGGRTRAGAARADAAAPRNLGLNRCHPALRLGGVTQSCVARWSASQRVAITNGRWLMDDGDLGGKARKEPSTLALQSASAKGNRLVRPSVGLLKDLRH